MVRVAMLLWILLSTVAMGIFVLIVLTVPALSLTAKTWIPVAVVAGCLIAIPFSFIIAKAIMRRPV